MNLSKARNCPICGTQPTSSAFPYATMFNGVFFKYLKCSRCSSVFVDPIPDSKTFAKMYAKADYHDCYYGGKECGEYLVSTKVLKQYLPAGAFVLDYGCGLGGFLTALKEEGFIPYGVEFDQDAAFVAGLNAGCKAISVDEFQNQSVKPIFDAIYFGDVLEHLPDPANTLKELLGYLKPDGVLFVEGPLEINPSPVYWACLIFGAIKRLVRPKFVASHPPTHLFRTGELQQLAFFLYVEPRLTLKHWQVYETGWPYASGSVIKQAIAGLAKGIGGRELFGRTLGNRFRGVFIYQGSSGDSVQPQIEG